METEKFDLKKWFSGLINPVTWGKSIQYLVMICAVLFVAFAIKNTFFPTKSNVNKPVTIVTPFAKVEKIDNTSTQISVEKEKSFEVGVGVAGMRYDNKDGAIVGGWGKWKF
jgi:Na+(H+)/acetate symporter ActP